MGEISENVKKRRSPGVLIIDNDNTLLFSNDKALGMIPDLRGTLGRGRTRKPHVPPEILDLCNRLKDQTMAADNIPESVYGMIASGSPGVYYSLRAFFIGKHGEGNPTHIMVLIERMIEKREIDYDKAMTEFSLSKRETEVLRLLCSGMTNRDIANTLFISEYTVKDHIKKIMGKVKATSRSEIIANLM
jgi:DNA-binding CsgD family transcriptional regulator